jgi:hypothetical protein
MYFFGPYAPGTTGTSSTIKTSAASGSVAISKYGAAAVTSTQNGMKFFAGPRDDPFFFDLGQFQAILGGTATAFKTQVWILLLVQMYYQLWLKFLKQC